MATGFVGDSIRLQVTFRSWSETPETSEIEDPVSVLFEVYNDDASPTLILSTAATKISDGVYYYIWTPLEAGTFTTQFVGTFDDDSVDEVTAEFVISEQSDTILETSGTSLGTDYLVAFTGVIDPLYIDPAEIAGYFPDVLYSEIAEIIYRYSVQLKDLLSLGDDEAAPWIGQEWIAAATACELSRQQDWSGGSGNVNMVQLGDLMVKTGAAGARPGVITRGTASNWCELAGAIRVELLHMKTKPRAVVRGAAYQSPIPPRQLKDWESNGRFYPDSPIMQGLLDELKKRG